MNMPETNHSHQPETIFVRDIPSVLAVFYEGLRAECPSCEADVELLRQRTIPNLDDDGLSIRGDELTVRCIECGETARLTFLFEKSGDGPPVRLLEMALESMLESNAKRPPYPSCSRFNREMRELFEVIDQEDALADAEPGSDASLRTRAFGLIRRLVQEAFEQGGSPLDPSTNEKPAGKRFKMLSQSLRVLPREEVRRLVLRDLPSEIRKFILVRP
jgi:hypothetical protein